jgi:hypothetical protein
LSESIELLSIINKKEIIKTKKEIHKEKRIQEKLERIWEDKQARAFWTSEMKFNESKNSLNRFKNMKDYSLFPF